MEPNQAAIVLARWLYYGAVMVLFGSSLFPLYALAGRDPTPAVMVWTPPDGISVPEWWC